MSHRSTRKAKSIITQSAELALAVPCVVVHRATRMAQAGPRPSARDLKEFNLMVAEKGAAFVQSWQGMAMQTMLAHQAMAASLIRSFWSVSPRAKVSPAKIAAQLQGAALAILGKGLAPVHRKATANARRLGRRKRR